MNKYALRFNINPNLYLKDPQSSEYGQKLLANAILLLDKIGLEAFTFRKLATEISSTEASIYRYFENKHVLLLYLVNWYWERVNYLIDINLKNIENPERKLKVAIHQIANASNETSLTDYINPKILHQVIINEGSKAYHIHDVDQENKMGYFLSYKDLVDRISKIIKEIDPNFPYPRIMASNLFEMAHNQIYFAEHLPRLTDIRDGEKKHVDLEKAMNHFVDKLLK